MPEQIKYKKDEDGVARKYPWSQKVAFDMSNLYLNPDSVLHCDQCKERLGVLHTLRSALFKKPGTSYIVVCKSCRHPNVRIKGQYKKQMEEQWEHLQSGE